MKVALGPNCGLFLATIPQPDAFLAKYAPDGSPIFFTYLGGDGFDSASSVTVDAEDNILVAGTSLSSNFPTTNTAPGTNLGFLSKVSADGTKLLWSTRLPAPSQGAKLPAAVAKDGSIFVGSAAQSTSTTGSLFLQLSADGKTVLRTLDLPRILVPSRITADRNGDLLLAHRDGFSRISPSTWSSRQLATIAGIYIERVAIEPSGNLVAVGGNYRKLEQIEYSLLTTPNAFQRVGWNGDDLVTPVIRHIVPDGYMGKFTADGIRIAATLFSGKGSERIIDAVPDPGGNLVAIGNGGIDDLPLVSSLSMQTVFGGPMSFALKLDDKYESLRFSTFLSGFSAARILPHPEGGHWIVGSGIFNAPSGTGQSDVILQRIRSAPTGLPRIDSVAPPALRTLLRPGSTAIVKGDGFDASTVVVLGDIPLAPRNVTSTRMEILIPLSAPTGLVDLTVKTRDVISPPIRLRLYN